jgi:hypothetical protein
VLPGQETFLRWLKRLGCGLGIRNPESNFEERVEIPEDMRANNIEKLLEFVFPQRLLQNIRLFFNKFFEKLNILDKMLTQLKTMQYLSPPIKMLFELTQNCKLC